MIQTGLPGFHPPINTDCTVPLQWKLASFFFLFFFLQWTRQGKKLKNHKIQPVESYHRLKNWSCRICDIPLQETVRMSLCVRCTFYRRPGSPALWLCVQLYVVWSLGCQPIGQHSDRSSAPQRLQLTGRGKWWTLAEHLHLSTYYRCSKLKRLWSLATFPWVKPTRNTEMHTNEPSASSATSGSLSRKAMW